MHVDEAGRHIAAGDVDGEAVGGRHGSSSAAGIFDSREDSRPEDNVDARRHGTIAVNERRIVQHCARETLALWRLQLLQSSGGQAVVDRRPLAIGHTHGSSMGQFRCCDGCCVRLSPAEAAHGQEPGDGDGGEDLAPGYATPCCLGEEAVLA